MQNGSYKCAFIQSRINTFSMTILLTEEVPFISTPGDNTTFSKWSSESYQGLATCIKREMAVTSFSVILMLSLLDHNIARIFVNLTFTPMCN